MNEDPSYSPQMFPIEGAFVSPTSELPDIFNEKSTKVSQKRSQK